MFINKKPYIVGMGGINFDVHVKTNGEIIKYNSNTAAVKTSCGGVTRNIMENLARLGNNCILLSTVGNDLFGKSLISECESYMDMSHIFVSDIYSTSTYIDILDHEGDMAFAANDMKNIENLPSSYIYDNEEIIKNAAAVVCDTNLNEELLAAVFDAAHDVPIFVDPVSIEKCIRIKPFLSHVDYLKPNILELEILTQTKCSNAKECEAAVKMLFDQGLKNALVSMGDEGCCYYESCGKTLNKKLAANQNMMNATGAGDSFFAGFIHGITKGMDQEQAVDFALGCGYFTTLCEETVNPEINEQNIIELIKKTTCICLHYL